MGHHQVPDHPSRAVEHRRSEVTVGRGGAGQLHLRKQVTEACPVEARTPFEDAQTGRAVEIVFEVVPGAPLGPEPQRPGALVGQTLRHEGVPHPERGRQVAHQLAEEVASQRRRCALGQRAQQLIGPLPRRDVARHREQLLGLSVLAGQGADDHVPPAWLLRPQRREEPDESPHLAGTCGLDRRQRGLAIGALPEVDPAAVQCRGQIVDLERGHAARVHGQQPPLEIQNFHAVRAALDDPCLQGLAGLRRRQLPPQCRNVVGRLGIAAARITSRVRLRRSVFRHP